MEDKQVVPVDWKPEEIDKANAILQARMVRAGGHGRCTVRPDHSVTHGGSHAAGDCHAVSSMEPLIMGMRSATPTIITLLVDVGTMDHEKAVAAVRDCLPLCDVSLLYNLTTPRSAFENELRSLINQHSQENGSNTPDYILASYLQSCLDAFNLHTRERDRWFGNRSLRGPGVTDDHFPPVPTSERSLLR